MFQLAKSSIRLIDAKLSDPDLVTLLNQRRDSGLMVHAYTDKRVGGLKSHGKIILIDDRLAVVGSLALAAISLGFRREVAIMTEDREAVATVQQLFESLASGPTPGRIGAGAARAAL
jgi:phosphatidylserine/phosphatidylglycerophosphate/cardiolipin synthase-like enzyme